MSPACGANFPVGTEGPLNQSKDRDYATLLLHIGSDYLYTHTHGHTICIFHVMFTVLSLCAHLKLCKTICVGQHTSFRL